MKRINAKEIVAGVFLFMLFLVLPFTISKAESYNSTLTIDGQTYPFEENQASVLSDTSGDWQFNPIDHELVLDGFISKKPISINVADESKPVTITVKGSCEIDLDEDSALFCISSNTDLIIEKDDGAIPDFKLIQDKVGLKTFEAIRCKNQANNTKSLTIRDIYLSISFNKYQDSSNYNAYGINAGNVSVEKGATLNISDSDPNDCHVYGVNCSKFTTNDFDGLVSINIVSMQASTCALYSSSTIELNGSSSTCSFTVTCGDGSQCTDDDTQNFTNGIAIRVGGGRYALKVADDFDIVAVIGIFEGTSLEPFDISSSKEITTTSSNMQYAYDYESGFDSTSNFPIFQLVESYSSKKEIALFSIKNNTEAVSDELYFLDGVASRFNIPGNGGKIYVGEPYSFTSLSLRNALRGNLDGLSFSTDYTGSEIHINDYGQIVINNAAFNTVNSESTTIKITATNSKHNSCSLDITLCPIVEHEKYVTIVDANGNKDVFDVNSETSNVNTQTSWEYDGSKKPGILTIKDNKPLRYIKSEGDLTIEARDDFVMEYEGPYPLTSISEIGIDVAKNLKITKADNPTKNDLVLDFTFTDLSKSESFAMIKAENVEFNDVTTYAYFSKRSDRISEPYYATGVMASGNVTLSGSSNFSLSTEYNSDDVNYCRGIEAAGNVKLSDLSYLEIRMPKSQKQNYSIHCNTIEMLDDSKLDLHGYYALKNIESLNASRRNAFSSTSGLSNTYEANFDGRITLSNEKSLDLGDCKLLIPRVIDGMEHYYIKDNSSVDVTKDFGMEDRIIVYTNGDDVTESHISSFDNPLTLQFEDSDLLNYPVSNFGESLYMPKVAPLGAVTGGIKPYKFSVESSLPDGISINENTGLLSGKPTNILDSDKIINIKVTDSSEEPESKEISIKFAKLIDTHPVISLKFSEDEKQIELNDNSQKLVPTILPEEATNKEFKITSSDKEVCGVEDSGEKIGTLYPKKPGYAIITAYSKTNEAIYDTIKVFVKEKTPYANLDRSITPYVLTNLVKDAKYLIDDNEYVADTNGNITLPSSYNTGVESIKIKKLFEGTLPEGDAGKCDSSYQNINITTVDIENNPNVTIKCGGCSFTADDTSVTIPSYSYDGKPIEIFESISYNGVELQRDKDYFLEYIANTYPGTATIIITGKKEYKGEITLTFTIEKQNLSEMEMLLDGVASAEYVYDGKEHVPTVEIGNLVENSDYSLEFTGDKVEPGTVEVTATAIGSFCTGSIKGTYKINKIPVVVYAKNDTVNAGGKIPEFKYSVGSLFTNFKEFWDLDEMDKVLGELSYECEATKDSPEGDYEIKVSGVSETNHYELTYFPGTLTITQPKSTNIPATATPLETATPAPTNYPSESPTPSVAPTKTPTVTPTIAPKQTPTQPANTPSIAPTVLPSAAPTVSPDSANNGTQNTNKDDSSSSTTKLKKIKIKSVKAKAGSKKITGKLSVTKAKVKIKVGKKAWKKAKVKKNKFTLKTTKLNKKTKIQIKVTKKGYKTLKKTVKVK